MNITFKVECNKCGADLDIVNYNMGDYTTLEVDPCQACVDDAVHDAVEEAKEEKEE